MMGAFLQAKIYPRTSPTNKKKINNDNKLQSPSQIVLPTNQVSTRRHVWISCVSLVSLDFNFGKRTHALAEDKSNGQREEDESGVFGAIKTLFDPNEKIKSGKVLPKDYLNAARQVVKSLRESLNEDPADNAKFRRTADGAKEAIRDYLSKWRGQDMVVKEESYVEIEKAIRTLAGFYSKAGPSARLPEEVKSEILKDLNEAEQFL